MAVLEVGLRRLVAVQARLAALQAEDEDRREVARVGPGRENPRNTRSARSTPSNAVSGSGHALPPAKLGDHEITPYNEHSCARAATPQTLQTLPETR